MKIAYLTLGCKLNYAETSTYERGFTSHGFETVPWNGKADVYLVNTCSVTQHSDNKCRNIIRKCHRTNPDAVIVATGCYAELRREEVAALEEDRTGDFLQLIIDSGRSSYIYLQNVYAPETDQSLSLALCMAEQMLKGKGAWRIHGGGFAGTTLNFVPTEETGRFVETMNSVFGEKACTVLSIRPEGAAWLKC